MTQERIELLDQLGFSWEVRPSLERPRATWQQRLEELQAYHKSYGNFLVDPLVMPQLHAWCHEQRNRLKLLDKNNGKDLSKRMNPERAQALQAVGFTKDTILLDAGAALTKMGDLVGIPMVSNSPETSTEPSQTSPSSATTTNVASSTPDSNNNSSINSKGETHSSNVQVATNNLSTRTLSSPDGEWENRHNESSYQDADSGPDIAREVVLV